MAKLNLATRPTTAKDYGIHLFYVKVIERVSKMKEITLRADGMNIDDNGTLSFYQVVGDDILNTITFANGQWQYAYLAEEQGQHPACVERWKDVAGVRVVEIEQPVIKVIEKDIVTEKEIIKEVPVTPEEVTEESTPEDPVVEPEESAE